MDTDKMTSDMVFIKDAPAQPFDFFQQLLERRTSKFTYMNLATLDDEFGVLNRTVVLGGIIDGSIVYVTERKTRNCINIQRDPRIGVTFVFPDVHSKESDAPEFWQVRLIGAEAVELDREQIAKLWQEGPLHAKIRSYVCECGKPIDYEQLKRSHDELLDAYKAGKHKLEQTSTYIAYKFVPKRWDFYTTRPDCIADRVQYRLKEGEHDKWEMMHVCA